ncbi:MAG: tetratricopeptide repeat protein [Labilithrix sp.]|nr:tetratricopeptide repeat protein [Labilithrix sp.]MCW5813773.1 tetratricopeptide repeat protein [Labilithrix sp.]
MRLRDLSTHRVAPLAGLAVMLVACSGKSSGPEVKNPERQSDAEYDLARDTFQKGETRQALDHVQKAVAYNEENDRAHYLHAVILLAFCSGPRGFDGPDCRLADIEKAARAALKANPDFRDAKNLLGQVLINAKKYKDAIAVLEPLTKDPAYVFPHYAWGNLGWAQVLDGQLDAGISSLRNSVTEPRFCVGHYRLGIGLEKKGDAAMAEQSFSSAITADPQCAELQDAWESRARVRVKLGKTAEAREDYEHCAKISKETATGQTCVRELAKLASAPPSSSGVVLIPFARRHT